ncbi:MAG: formylmethanofuran--tetrahydromethanopterin N-formyltransferase [Phycisphaera sp.]|nr:formylmethanofuran--tetrahydromethanopterin N-formyltransferase [Phycisphaera sp.]
MHIHNTLIDDQFAEAFRMWACRLIVTAIDEHWAQVAAREATGYGSSVIGCDAEAGLERTLTPDETPDGRPGVSLLFFAFNAKALAKAIPNRVGQCLMTCPTASVYDGLPGVVKSDDSDRFDLGKKIRYFGDGYQKSKRVESPTGPRRYWRVPVMDGEFVVEESVGCVKAIGGGNYLLCGRDQKTTLDAARRGVEAIAHTPNIITPFPGGVVRSGSKVGSRYKALFASTNHFYCPTLRRVVPTLLQQDVGCVYEIVINGLTENAIAGAMRDGILASIGPDIIAVSAGNYGGKLGKFHFKLRTILGGDATA